PEAAKRCERAAKDPHGEYPVLPGVAGMALEHSLVDAHLLPGIHVPEPQMLHLHGDGERCEEDREENVCWSGGPHCTYPTPGRAIRSTPGRPAGACTPSMAATVGKTSMPCTCSRTRPGATPGPAMTSGTCSSSSYRSGPWVSLPCSWNSSP